MREPGDDITVSAPEYRVERKKPAASNDIVTEDGAALRFAELYGERLRFCHDTKAWFSWTGSLWEQNRTGVAFQWARELARQMTESEPDKVRFVSSKTSFAAGVERFARHDPVFAVTAEYWNRAPFLLGTPGGTIDLTTGALRPARPVDGISKAVAVVPADKAECPLWARFIAETTGNDVAMIRFIKQWCGYALTGDVREHALVFVFGDGGNGKSVFVNVLTGILCAYAATAAMDTFIASHGHRHSTDLAMLQGARLVAASETEEGRQWAEAKVKQLTGGDAITARFMHKDNFTFKPQFKLTVIGNHKPTMHNVDDAQRRRFNIVPFTRKPASPDKQLEEKLRAEWPAILRWMIEGCLDWQANGLVRPPTVIDATAEYFADQDLIAQWLEDDCDAEPGNNWKSAASGELFASWSAYATKAGEKSGSQKSFAETMKRRGFLKRRGTQGVRRYDGVRLKVR